jgi:hypothetical protein
MYSRPRNRSLFARDERNVANGNLQVIIVMDVTRCQTSKFSLTELPLAQVAVDLVKWGNRRRGCATKGRQWRQWGGQCVQRA